METLAKKRHSRLSTDPVYWPDGSEKKVKLTARDRRQLWPILQRYQMLPTDYIFFLLGEDAGNYTFFSRRLGSMARKPNLFLKKPIGQKSPEYRRRCLVYALAETPIPKFFMHGLLANMAAAQFELSCRSAALDLVTFDRILPKAPPETQAAKHPCTFSVNWEYFKNRFKTSDVSADWPPFAIGRDGNYIFFNGIEADCDSETNEPHADNPARMDHATIERKFRQYLALLDQGIIERQLGIPGPVYIPFVTTNPNNISTWQRQLLRLTDGQGHPNIIIRHMPAYDDEDEPPTPPDSNWALGGWKRAAGPNAEWTEDFYIEQTV
jgi:hypothetical protein